MFSKTFCSSPWIHTRINNAGDFEPCRWLHKSSDINSGQNIAQVSPIEWFQIGMQDIRRDLLQGKTLNACRHCHEMEKHHKVSGRQRQLLKTGITVQDFTNTVQASPWLDQFTYSMQNEGHTGLVPQDWQIDLGNTCNSACVMCSPSYSSRMATEYLSLGMIGQMPQRSWTDDPVLLQRFLDALAKSPRVKYLHFIGGETLLTPAFKRILLVLIDSGLHQDCTIGFTTNLTVWNAQINELLVKFQSVNAGLSVECLHPVNDYIRYPSNLDTTCDLLKKWIHLAKAHSWFVQLRVTPTLLSVLHLDTVYKFAFENEVAVEACNFLEHPKFLRPSLLPASYRRTVIDRLEHLCKDHNEPVAQLINTRHPDLVTQQLTQDLRSYINYLNHEPQPDGLHQLVHFLHAIEGSRGNRILHYLPEYEELLRSAGYQN